MEIRLWQKQKQTKTKANISNEIVNHFPSLWRHPEVFTIISFLVMIFWISLWKIAFFKSFELVDVEVLAVRANNDEVHHWPITHLNLAKIYKMQCLTDLFELVCKKRSVAAYDIKLNWNTQFKMQS